MDAMSQSDARAKGFADMGQRLLGTLGDASIVEPRQANIAYLEGMLSRLDETRLRITETIDRVERSIERARDAEDEEYRESY